MGRRRRQAQQLGYLVRPTYRGMPNPTGLNLERHLSLPLTSFRPDGKRVVQTADFLPDRLSFSGMPFSQSPHLEFVTRHFREASFRYENTRYFQLALSGHLPFPCKGRVEAAARCKKLIDLASRIKQQGYDPRRFGAITLTPCLDGSMMVLNGKHRLAILQSLGVSKFPVAVCPDNEVLAFYRGAIDRAWPPRLYRKSLTALANLGTPVAAKQDEVERLRADIKNARLETWADVYHPIPFYEFRDLTTQVEPLAAYQRLGMILSQYPSFRNLRVLDVGANIGFYSFSLARRGARVTAVESRPEYAAIARRLSAIYDVPVDFRSSPATPEIDGEYDVVLCFSMLQWVIAAHGLDYGRRLLRAFSEHCRALFFDVSINRGKSCLQTTPGEEQVFAEDLLRTSTAFREIRHVGDVHPYGIDTRHVFFCRR